MSHYVYALGCGTYVKVGIARNVHDRVKEMLIGNPFEMEILKAWEVNSKKIAALVERESHKKLKQLGMHHRGEWFLQTKSDEVVDAVDFVLTEIVDEKLIRKDKILREMRMKINFLDVLSKKEKKIISEIRRAKKQKDGFVYSIDEMRTLLNLIPIKEISNETGLKPSTVRNVRNNPLANPTYAILKALSDYLESRQ